MKARFLSIACVFLSVSASHAIDRHESVAPERLRRVFVTALAPNERGAVIVGQRVERPKSGLWIWANKHTALAEFRIYLVRTRAIVK